MAAVAERYFIGYKSNNKVAYCKHPFLLYQKSKRDASYNQPYNGICERS